MTWSMRRSVATTLVVLAGTCAGIAAQADDKAAKQVDPATDPMMAEMMKYAMPGAAHAAFKPMEGKFKAVVKSWYGPGEPTTSEGTMENRIVLGGRYLESRYVGTMLGQPFEGFSLMGYDNRAKKLWSLWIDNMTTESMMQTGTISDDGKLITCKGTSAGPDGKPMEYTAVTKVVDDKSHTFSMTGMMDGKEVPLMEIAYTRQ